MNFATNSIERKGSLDILIGSETGESFVNTNKHLARHGMGFCVFCYE